MNKENITKVNFKYRSKLILKTTQSLMSKNQVGIFMPDLFIKFYYPIDKASLRVKSYLINGAPLSKEFEEVRKELHRITDETPYFIHSLLTHWYLDDKIKNLCDDRYEAIGSVNRIPLMSFVSAHGQENLFFVVGEGSVKNEDKRILRCIEVHKHKPITYRTVYLLSTQVTQTRRISSGMGTLS